MLGQQLGNFFSLEQQNEFWNPIEDFSKSRSLSSESQSTEDCDSESLPNYNELQLVKAQQYSLSEQKPSNPSGYQQKLKTELCRNFIYSGICRFGSKCSFAHGYDELQSKMHISNNYKTKPCKSFFGTGYCQYGERCQFLHSEIKQSIQSSNLKYYQQKLNTFNLIGCQNCNIIQLLENTLSCHSKRSDTFKNYSLLKTKVNSTIN